MSKQNKLEFDVYKIIIQKHTEEEGVGGGNVTGEGVRESRKRYTEKEAI